MPTITPSLNLPQPPLASAAMTKPASPVPAPVAAAASPAPATPPSTTVTLSPQAMSALAAANHPSSSSASTGATPAPAPVAHDDSIYDAVKHGITTAVTDVGDAIAGGAHAVVDGVETAVSTVHDVAKGIVAFPFAAVSKASDAVGAFIDEF